jgi:hypothetical protein
MKWLVIVWLMSAIVVMTNGCVKRSEPGAAGVTAEDFEEIEKVFQKVTIGMNRDEAAGALKELGPSVMRDGHHRFYPNTDKWIGKTIWWTGYDARIVLGFDADDRVVVKEIDCKKGGVHYVVFKANDGVVTERRR